MVESKNVSESNRSKAEKMSLTERRVEQLRCPPGARERVVWDLGQPGLAVRVQGGAASYVTWYRIGGRLRRYTIGSISEHTLADARATAARARLLAREGRDLASEEAEAARVRTEPPAEGTTVAAVARSWYESTAGRKKETSRASDLIYVERFIVPALGDREIASITFTDVEKFHRSVTDGSFRTARKATGRGARPRKEGGTPYQANRVKAALSAILSYAERRELRPMGSNPCRWVKPNRELPRHRALTDDELARLATALQQWPTAPHKIRTDETGVRRKHSRTGPLTDRAIANRRRAVDAIKTLLLTGCRKSEIAALRWSEVDEGRAELHLADAKTGARTVLLNAPALAIVKRQPKLQSSDEPFVFMTATGQGGALDAAWEAVRARAGLGRFRLHDLRHHVGEWLTTMGHNEAVVAKVLGHSRSTITARYVSVRDEVLRRAVEEYGRDIGNVLGEVVTTSDARSDQKPRE